jgi:hypothetical protein
MLPLYKTEDQVLQLWQTKWKAELDPVLSNPILNGTLLESVSLANGVTVVNHRLGRRPRGWFIVDINAAATVYRSQPLTEKTITLTSDAAATCKLWVF